MTPATDETTKEQTLPVAALVNLANTMPDLILVSLEFESLESGNLREKTVLRILDLYPSRYAQQVLIVREDKELLARYRYAMIQRLCKVDHVSSVAIRITDVVQATDTNGAKWVYDPTQNSPFGYTGDKAPKSSTTAFAAQLTAQELQELNPE